MPIPIAKLEAAQRPLDEQILEFLRGRPEQAFTWTEIYAGVTGTNEEYVELAMLLAKDSARKSVRLKLSWKKALDGLVAAKKVRTARVGGEDYYGIVK